MHQIDFLSDAVLIYGIALLVAWLFRYIGAPSIIGFLVTGLLIGPPGLGLIAQDDVGALAELGLVLLLFMIGLELSPTPLLRMGRGLLRASVMQIGLTAAVAFGACFWGLRVGWPVGILIGVAVSLSSTAIVLKQLSDKGTSDTLVGRVTTGVLLIQDVFVITVMLLLPIFAGGGADWRHTLVPSVLGVAGLVVALVAGRRILPWLFERIVLPGGQEFMALFAVVAAFGGAWLAGWVGWSLPLGACIAGMLLAEADARHQMAADVLPFRDVFNALFFVSLGMMADIDLALAHAAGLGALIVLTLIGKSVVTSVAVRVGGWTWRPALQIGIGLATVSEFGFVLVREANKLELVSDDLLSFFVVYALGTMLFGAAMVPLAPSLATALAGLLERDDARVPEEQGDKPLRHVVVVGYGPNGQNLGKVLEATRIPFVVVEMNHRLVSLAKENGAQVIAGDACRLGILKHAGLEDARAAVIAINDPGATSRVVAQVRSLRRDIYILVRTRFDSELDELYRLGADRVISQDFETSIEISAYVLKEMDVPDNVVEGQLAALRSGRYGMLRGLPVDREASEELRKVLELTATRTHFLSEGRAVCGRTIAQVNLRAETGVTIIAVVRNGKPWTSPPADFVLKDGDVLVLVGAHVQLEAAKGVLNVGEGEGERDGG